MSDTDTGHKKRQHWWSRGTGVRLRLWMVVNITALGTLCYLVSEAVTTTHTRTTTTAAQVPAKTKPASESAAPKAVPPVLTKDQILHPSGIYYGVATPHAPWSDAELQQVAARAGAQPTMVEYFLKWTQDFDAKAVAAAYKDGAVPVLTWEPWAPHNAEAVTAADLNEPDYQLAKIAGGSFDAYITRFAQAVAAGRAPVVLRFAHEMNGDWYPWSEQANGNKPGDYVKAWRHVHDLFQQAGATNVIWVWSPNIIRPVPHVKLTPLYPGDAYVDWIGVVGYGNEADAQSTFGATLQNLRQIAHKPILITETSAQPAVKAKWTTDFFSWLPKNPDIVGFVWFEKDKTSGGTEDWRFDATPDSLTAFIGGLKSLSPRLAKLEAPAAAAPTAGATAAAQAPPTAGATAAGAPTAGATAAAQASPAAGPSPTASR